MTGTNDIVRIVSVGGQTLRAAVGDRTVTVTLPDTVEWHLSKTTCPPDGSHPHAPGILYVYVGRKQRMLTVTASDLLRPDAAEYITERVLAARQVYELAVALSGGDQ